LGLEDTYTATDEKYPEDRLARGYAHDTGAPQDVTHLYPISLAGPAGDMVSTASDLLHWLQAVFGGKVIDEPYLSQFAAAQVAGAFEATSISGHGLGTLIYTFHDLEVVGYSGGIQGYISLMCRHLESGIDVVILTNSYHSALYVHQVAGLERPFESVFRTALAAL